MFRAGAVLAAALTLAGLVPTRAHATTAANLCAAATNPCVWSGDILVGPASVLDFGTRDLVISGSGIIRVAGGDSLIIRAHRVTFQAGTGGRIRGDTTSSAPLLVRIETTEDVVFLRSGTARGRIDLRGDGGGGRISIAAGRNVDMGGEIQAMGTTTAGDGGSIDIAATGDITVNGDIDVSGGLEAVGGDVSLTAGGTFLAGSLTPEPLIDGRAGLEGGSLDIAAGPLLSLGADVIMNGSGPGSDGGFVDLSATGDLRILSKISADGSGSIDFGGFGGDVSLSAGGTLTIGEVISLSGGAPDGEGGTLDVSAGLDLLQQAQLSLEGGGDLAFGGTILLTAGRSATLSALIDIHGGSGGGGGYLQVQANHDVQALAEINGNADGGYILLSTLVVAPGGTVVAGPAVVSGNVHAIGTAAGFGGVVNVQACDVTVVAAGTLGTAGPGSDTLVQGSGKVVVRGHLTAASPGGTNRIQFRDPAQLPDLAGAIVAPPATQTQVASLPPCGVPVFSTTSTTSTSTTSTSTISTSTTSTTVTTTTLIGPTTSTTSSTTSLTVVPTTSTSTSLPTTTSTLATTTSTTVATTTSTLATTTSTSVPTTTSTTASTTSTTVATTTSTLESTTSTSVPTTTSTSVASTTSTSVPTTTSTTETSTSTITITTTTSTTSSVTTTLVPTTSSSTTSSTTLPSAPATCVGGCDDGDPCTDDACVDGACRASEVTGSRSVTCVCERETAAGCAGQPLSPRFTQKVGKACSLLERAVTLTGNKAKKSARGAARNWKAAGKLLGKRAIVKNLSPACVSALQAEVADALGRTASLPH